MAWYQLFAHAQSFPEKPGKLFTFGNFIRIVQSISVSLKDAAVWQSNYFNSIHEK